MRQERGMQTTPSVRLDLFAERLGICGGAIEVVCSDCKIGSELPLERSERDV